MAIVEGEAGIGKTRLVHEALGHSAIGNRQVLVGHCHRLREPFPLGPVIEALRGADIAAASGSSSSLVGALRPLLPELAAHLPACPEPLSDPRAQRHRVFRALREMLSALGSVVCVLEDMHWADESTLELLSFLLSDPPSELALVLTSRMDDADGMALVMRALSHPSRRVLKARIELPPLSEAQVRALACSVLDIDEPEELPGMFADHLYERTGGIPFVVEEVMSLLRDRGAVSSEPGALEVPRAVRDCILERFDALAADAQLVAGAAAVVENPVGEDLLGKVAGLPPARVRRGLTEALRVGLLAEKPKPSYSFRHALAAQAVYEHVPAPQRRWLHLRAARALESGLDPLPLSQIAHHFREADLPRQWMRYAEAAAKSAHDEGDDRSATQLLQEALATPGLGHAARVRMATELGIAALYSVAPIGAIALLERVLEEEDLTATVRGELRFSLCRLRFHAGDAGAWREQMARAVDELEGRPALAARAMINLAQPARLTDDTLADHLAWLERALDAAQRQDDPVTHVAASAQRATILLTIGDPAGWEALDEIPTGGGSAEERLQLLRGYHSLAQAALDLGYSRRAEELLDRAEAIHEEIDHTWWKLWLAGTRASLDWTVGRWERLEARVRALVEHTANTPGASLEDHVVLGSLLLSRGAVEDAARSLTSTLIAARGALWAPPLVAASGHLARIHLDRGEVDAAGGVAGRALDVVRRKGLWVCAAKVAPMAVDVLLAQGDRPAARQLVGEFASGLRARDAPAARAALAICRGALAEADGRHAEACRSFARAERAWHSQPYPYAAALARERRAVCLFGQRDERGGELLVGALETFEALGARWDAARVRAQLRSQGTVLPYPLRGGRKSYGRELSPKESEVARLAGMGWSNREIATALFISPHTVAGHVSSALRKLGLTSRQVLGSSARQSDGVR